MGKRKVGILPAAGAAFGALLLAGRVMLLGQDHFVRGKLLLANAWERIEDKALQAYVPRIYYDPEREEGSFWERAGRLVEDSLACWNYIRAGEETVCLEDESTWEAIEEATHKSIAERLRESGETDSAPVPEETDAEDTEDTEDAEDTEDGEKPLEAAFTLPEQQAVLSLEKMQDFDYLLNNFFVLDPTTTITREELNIDSLLGKDLTMKQDSSAPQILIYHSHSQEGFADSVEGDPSTSVVAVGDYLEQILAEEYGYQVIHMRDTFDVVDGVWDRSAAYDYALEKVEQVLAENPSIEVVIDLHRDGVREDVRLVTEVNGKPTARIMFFNGLSKSRTNGPIEYLYNPYIADNLAFSFRLEYEAAQYYPDLTRCVYLKCYRYNLHVRPKSLLLEVGAQTNTLEEAKNAMEPFAVILNKVLKGT